MEEQAELVIANIMSTRECQNVQIILNSSYLKEIYR